MYIRLTRGRFDSSKTDQIQRLAQKQLVPAIKQRPGFKSYHGGVNREAGTLVAIRVPNRTWVWGLLTRAV